MTHNQLFNFYSFCCMFNGINNGEGILYHDGDYLFEKYNSFINYLPKINETKKVKLRNSLYKNKDFNRWKKRWSFNSGSKLHSNPNIALLVFEIYGSHTLYLNKLWKIFERNVGNIWLIDDEIKNIVHPRLKELIISDIIPSIDKSVLREIKISEILKSSVDY